MRFGPPRIDGDRCVDGSAGVTECSDEHCEACAAPLREGASFCPGCGRRVRENETHGAMAGSRWDLVRPALQLWCVLLAINVLVSLGLRVAGDAPTWVEMLLAETLWVVALTKSLWPESRRLWGLVRDFGYRGYRIAEPLLAVFIVWVFMNAYMKLAGALGIHMVGIWDTYSEHGWPIWPAYLLNSVFPAVAEELAFRGMIMWRLSQVTGRRDALVVQAAMFSVLHLLPASYPSHFVIGLLLGLLHLRSGSLLPCMLTHGLWNAWVLTEELWST